MALTLQSQLKNCVVRHGALVQLVRMPACHAGGRWFESCTHRSYIESEQPLGLLAFNVTAVRTGLEPATSCVTGRHSNQLN